jgi:hypothetical protein
MNIKTTGGFRVTKSSQDDVCFPIRGAVLNIQWKVLSIKVLGLNEPALR